MQYDKVALETNFERLKSVLDSLSGMTRPPQPIETDAGHLTAQLDLLKESGAPDAPQLFEYFGLLEKYGLHTIADLYEYTDPCDIDRSIDVRQFKFEITRRIHGVVTDVYDEVIRQGNVIWPRNFVPISETEGRGYAVVCGSTDSGTVWTFDKSGNLVPEFDSINAFSQALVESFEGKGQFANSVPQLDSDGFLEWV